MQVCTLYSPSVGLGLVVTTSSCSIWLKKNTHTTLQLSDGRDMVLRLELEFG